ncbi:glycosyltransferase [Ornithinimicrobium sp. LYQ103]|uniref:glycosyltransferase n=1 Tax=Ornithinimicrobium sp. LYQ103 TaxID=3378796 RepID=UPI0038522683
MPVPTPATAPTPLCIALLAAGSRGDYQPLVAVGRGLAARGHDVGVTATTDFVDLVRAGGLRPEEVRVDAMRYYREDLAGRGMPTDLDGQMGLLGDLARVLAPEVTRTMRDLWPRYDGFVTTAMSATWAGLFGARDPRPQVLMMFVPALPSVWGDSSLFAVEEGRSLRNLGAGLRSLRGAVQLASPVEDELARNGLSGRDRRRAVRRMVTSPAFVANSVQLVTPRRVFGRAVRCVGYPFLDSPPGTALPTEVERFLTAGPPPVFVGLGSHTLPAVRDALRHTVGAALGLGQRVLVMAGSGLESDGGYGENVAFVGDVPHDLLFPRTAVIVQHGGAGTSAVALRAGRPQVVLPFTMDQPFFARRLHEIGVGAPPVPTEDAGSPDGVRRLRGALSHALSPHVADRAAEVARAVSREDGVAGAVAEIERALGRGLGRQAMGG